VQNWQQNIGVQRLQHLAILITNFVEEILDFKYALQILEITIAAPASTPQTRYLFYRLGSKPVAKVLNGDKQRLSQKINNPFEPPSRS
jgi:hypothetical protein